MDDLKGPPTPVEAVDRGSFSDGRKASDSWSSFGLRFCLNSGVSKTWDLGARTLGVLGALPVFGINSGLYLGALQCQESWYLQVFGDLSMKLGKRPPATRCLIL